MSNESVARAVVGVSICILGVAVSLLGLAFIFEGSRNINPYPILGVFIALFGVFLSFVSATPKRNANT